MIRDAFNEGKEAWFRDERQLDEVRAIVHDRLANDRYQQECRYLMRFWWHLRMSYEEVAYEDLLLHLSDRKIKVLEALFDAIDTSHDAIDDWIKKQENDWPMIDKRAGYPDA